MNNRTVGIIGGSSLFNCKWFESRLKRCIIETNEGAVVLYKGIFQQNNQNSIQIVFCQRHHADLDTNYRQPAKINFKAITLAFKECKCDQILGVYSVGSLNSSIPVGQLVLPDDFFSPFSILHHSEKYEAHQVPSITESLRETLKKLLTKHAFDFYDGGVYVQSRGPRFETKAEVRFFKTCGDFIGMTGAHEAELLNELGLAYCMFGIVDNMANGIVSSAELTLEKFKRAQKENSTKMERAIGVILENI